MKSENLRINATKLKETLHYLIENNKKLQETGKIPIAINIESQAGLGKTSIVMELAQELDYQCTKINLSQVEEVGDLVGIPFKQLEVHKKDKDLRKWVTETAIPDYIKAGYIPTGNSRTAYATPTWVQQLQENSILFFDDYSRADARIIQASMEIISRQEYISWRLPKNCTIILSSNPDNGDYLVSTLDDAQLTRFINLFLKFDINCWAEWAEKEGIDTRCITFLLMHPELVNDSVNARQITTFFNAISGIEDFEKSLDLITLFGSSCVTEEFTNLFVTFIQNKLDRIISSQDILTRPMEYVEPILSSLFGKESTYRADIASVVATRLLMFLERPLAASILKNKELNQRFKELLLSRELFTDDIKFFMMRTIQSKHRAKFQEMLTSKEIIANLVSQ